MASLNRKIFFYLAISDALFEGLNYMIQHLKILWDGELKSILMNEKTGIRDWEKIKKE